jgi:signal peptidase II
MQLTAKQKGWLLLGAFAVGIVIVDQATKLWAESDLKERPGATITVIDGVFDLKYARNPGAAFSLFRDWSPKARGVFFIVVSIVAVGAMIVLYRRMPERRPLYEWALGLLIGGAVGNLIDRILRGEVVDFLHFRLWGGYSWPDFNFADSFIVTGVGLLLLELLASEGESRATQDGAGST